jgi:hypothetical protein
LDVQLQSDLKLYRAPKPGEAERTMTVRKEIESLEKDLKAVDAISTSALIGAGMAGKAIDLKSSAIAKTAE